MKNIYDLIDVKQREIKDILVESYHKTFQFACYQAVYIDKHKKHITYPQNVYIDILKDDQLLFIKENYNHYSSDDYLKNIMDRGHLWGIFENHQLAGFIGIHDEGSMGILEIKKEYRRKGYGSLLESYLINYFIDHDWIPFCQVLETNHSSLALQQKLGLKISKELSYWLFP